MRAPWPATGASAPKRRAARRPHVARKLAGGARRLAIGDDPPAVRPPHPVSEIFALPPGGIAGVEVEIAEGEALRAVGRDADPDRRPAAYGLRVSRAGADRGEHGVAAEMRRGRRRPSRSRRRTSRQARRRDRRRAAAAEKARSAASSESAAACGDCAGAGTAKKRVARRARKRVMNSRLAPLRLAGASISTNATPASTSRHLARAAEAVHRRQP